MVIANDGTGSDKMGNYWAKVMKGRTAQALHSQMCNMLRGKGGPYRSAEIKNFPRWRNHVWNLVAGALEALGYEHKTGKRTSISR